jgi:hypothetical protein
MTDPWQDASIPSRQAQQLTMARLHDPLFRCAVCGACGSRVILRPGYSTTLCSADANRFEVDTHEHPLWQEYQHIEQELHLLRIAHQREEIAVAYFLLWERYRRVQRELFDYCHEWIEHRRVTHDDAQHGCKMLLDPTQERARNAT